MTSDTDNVDILSSSGMIWIIYLRYYLVLMGIMWWVCERGLGGSDAPRLPSPAGILDYV
jgi:hypothetical protein